MKVAYITAIYGSYERSAKRHRLQDVPSDVTVDWICFTDRHDLESHGWDVDTTPYHTLYRKDQEDGVNSRNTHTFMVAKFYKQQWHRIPRMQQYDIVIWLDGTIEITAPDIIERLPEADISSWEHEFHATLAHECRASHFERYTSTHWFGQDQPYQDVDRQLRAYEDDGFPIHQEGLVFCTCFVVFDRRRHRDLVHTFLDMWYRQTIHHTTQDQLSFPYCLWKLKDISYARFRGTPHSRTGWFIKHGHHQ